MLERTACIVVRQADLRKLNAELNKQSQSVASEADAVLSSASNNGAGGSSSAHGKAALKPRTGVGTSLLSPWVAARASVMTRALLAGTAGEPQSEPPEAHVQ